MQCESQNKNQQKEKQIPKIKNKKAKMKNTFERIRTLRKMKTEKEKKIRKTFSIL